ncbi:MAG: universal stress protein [Thermoanaerobacterales bacterium]|nr:universal stress protein [Thermoanaerobacterales bacterium]
MLTKILAAVDGSANSIRAVHVAVDILLRDAPGTLTLVYVGKAPSALEWFHGPGGGLTGGLGEVERQEQAAIETATREGHSILEEAYAVALEKLKERPVRVEKLVVFGDPAEEIIRYAEEKGYDVVVMGSRGSGPLRGVLLGSVSYKVLNSARCPVLIVK